MTRMHTLKFVVRDPDGDRDEQFRIEGFSEAHTVGVLLESVPTVVSWCATRDVDGELCVKWDRDKQ